MVVIKGLAGLISRDTADRGRGLKTVLGVLPTFSGLAEEEELAKETEKKYE